MWSLLLIKFTIFTVNVFFFLSFFLVYFLPFAYVCGVQYSWVSREPMKTTMRRAGSRVVGVHATNAVDPGSKKSLKENHYEP